MCLICHLGLEALPENSSRTAVTFCHPLPLSLSAPSPRYDPKFTKSVPLSVKHALPLPSPLNHSATSHSHHRHIGLSREQPVTGLQLSPDLLSLSPHAPILKPDPQPTSDHKARTVLKIGCQPPDSPATHYFHGAVWITELLVIPQWLFCKHLHDLTGARAYMAGIYEKQAAIKILSLRKQKREI